MDGERNLGKCIGTYYTFWFVNILICRSNKTKILARNDTREEASYEQREKPW